MRDILCGSWKKPVFSGTKDASSAQAKLVNKLRPILLGSAVISLLYAVIWSIVYYAMRRTGWEFLLNYTGGILRYVITSFLDGSKLLWAKFLRSFQQTFYRSFHSGDF